MSNPENELLMIANAARVSEPSVPLQPTYSPPMSSGPPPTRPQGVVMRLQVRTQAAIRPSSPALQTETRKPR